MRIALGTIYFHPLPKPFIFSQCDVPLCSSKRRFWVDSNYKPTILVVDDEGRIRDLIRIFLETAGYRVLDAEGGRQAILLASNPDANIEILVTDIIMPFMNGRELANRICSINPYIKVLFISAYAAEILRHHRLCPDGADFIRKPFTSEDLLTRISRILASGPKWKDLVASQA